MNKIDIHNTKRRSTFIGVQHGAKVPPAVAKQYGVSTFLKTVDLDSPKPLVAMDKAQVAADIAANGFALIGAAVDVNEVLPAKKT